MGQSKLSLKRCLGLLAGLVVFGAGGFASADSLLKLNYQPSAYSSPFNGFGGGEFGAYDVSNLAFGQQSVVVGVNGNAFQTFCVEFHEDFVPGNTYSALVSQLVKFDNQPNGTMLP